jgi:predicted DNA-binding transcriptional regulator YafY
MRELQVKLKVYPMGKGLPINPVQRKNIIMNEDIDLEIDPKALNETEERQMVLLFNLLKFPNGIDFDRIRSIMSHYYKNENLDSDQKKLRRDMEALEDLGFPVQYNRSEDHYKIHGDSPETKLKFSPEELLIISKALVLDPKADQDKFSLRSLAQKIFGADYKLYPEFQKAILAGENQEEEDNARFNQTPATESLIPDEEDSARFQVLESILQAIKSKNPIRIIYERNFGKPTTKSIDPIQIVKKNASDLYLYAFDRTKQDYRNYLIPCIQKVTRMEDNFFKNHKPLSDSRSLHPLHFAYLEEPITLELEIRDIDIERWQSYLGNIDFRKEGNRFWIQTTNPRAIFPQMFKNSGSVLRLAPESLVEDYKLYLKKLSDLYSLS